jgi:Nickel responsive protein SCO4226-like
MPRFIVERTFVDGLNIPTDDAGAKRCLTVVQNNAEEDVTWVTSYVTTDRTRTYCVYDGPSAEAIHRAAAANGLPVDGITEVRVLDPYFYAGAAS